MMERIRDMHLELVISVVGVKRLDGLIHLEEPRCPG